MVAKESTKRKSSGSGKDSYKDNKKQKQDESDLSASALKRQVRKERQATRRHAESVTEAKALWNKLRMKTNTKEDTKKLMKEVMELIRGKVREIALQHDASRVVQAAIQFGSEEQRKEILLEICQTEGSLAEMAKIQYAHFCCLKFIKYCNRDDASIKMIVKSFKGEMPRLAVHGVGARVVESLFLNLPSKQTASLKQEFYGPHFSLFAQEQSTVPTLESNLKKAKTETQKKSAIDFVQQIINKGMTKSFYGFTYFQQLFAEYMDVADPGEIRTISSTVADHSIHLLSTRVGTRVVAACASYGTPKDRKRICKSLKGYTSSSLLHRDAYLALLRLVQVTDDTVSIQKSVLNEVLTKKDSSEEDGESADGILELATSDTGSKLFLMLVVEDEESRMKYFDPYERSILDPIPTIKENGKEVPTSKKDPDTRRKELLKHIKDALLETCTQNVKQLLKSLPGARVLKEVYASTGSEPLANAVVDVCEGSIDIFEDPVAHRSIKNLILVDVESDKPLFSKLLVDRLGANISDIAESNRGAFVAGALLKVPSVKATAKKTFSSNKKGIEAKSKQKGSTAGYAALLKEIS
mmetsp:Transcript_14336/g.36008  ORF Transcript_14336/g.36008 Transcript_14336/m.36008 type:complete len:583 (+) Transcript_14336:105-1853(+)